MPAQIAGAPTVQPTPGAADKFTFMLAAAMQMIPGSTYYPETGSAEWDYFMDQGIEVLKGLSYVADNQDTYPDAFANCGYVEDLLQSRAIVDSISVRCGMMRAVPSEELDVVKQLFQCEPRGDVFTSVMGAGSKIFTHVDSPGRSGYFEVTQKRGWPWQTEIIFSWTMADGTDGCFHFSLAKRGSQQILDPAVDKMRQTIIVIETSVIDEHGELRKVPFDNPSLMWVCDKEWVGKLLSPTKSTPGGYAWPCPVQHERYDTSDRRRADNVAYSDSNVEFSDMPLDNYEFENVGGYLCLKKRTKEGSFVHVKLCAFEILNVIKLVNYVEIVEGLTGFHLLLVRLLINSQKSKTVYLKYNDKNRNKQLDDAKEVLIEVPVCTSFKMKSDLSAALARYHPKLINMKLSTDMLAELISQNSDFPTKLAVVRLGMQEDESWVSSNIVFQFGKEPKLIEETVFEVVAEKVCIASVPCIAQCPLSPPAAHTHSPSPTPQFAKDKTTIQPANQPKNYLIPFPHVRYTIWKRYFLEHMPMVFQNNLVAAKAALASCVLSLYFSRIGKGEWTHFGNGFQITILHSQAFGTGKTTCMNEWHKILGWFKQPIEGNSLTHAGLWGRLNQTSCMMLFIDDKKVKKSQEDDLAGLLRNVYDKTSNTKSGVYKVVGSPVTISVSSSPLSAPSALKTRPAFTMVELANSGRVLPPNLLVHCVLPHTLRTHNWIN